MTDRSVASIWAAAVGACAGSRHRAAGLPSSDAFASRRIGADRIVAAVADGAGSARHGGEGARVAVATAIEELAVASDVFGWGAPTAWTEACESVFGSVRRDIRRAAAERSAEFEDFATTLLIADCGEQGSGFALIGDGGIVVRSVEGLSLPVSAMAGEFANETLFVTTGDGAVSARATWLEASVTAIAMFTDGLESLAIDHAAQSAHEPFFAPVFRVVESCDEEHATAQLQGFVESERVDARVDDDRTLLVAVRIPNPEDQPCN